MAKRCQIEIVIETSRGPNTWPIISMLLVLSDQTTKI